MHRCKCDWCKSDWCKDDQCKVVGANWSPQIAWNIKGTPERLGETHHPLPGDCHRVINEGPMGCCGIQGGDHPFYPVLISLLLVFFLPSPSPSCCLHKTALSPFLCPSKQSSQGWTVFDSIPSLNLVLGIISKPPWHWIGTLVSPSRSPSLFQDALQHSQTQAH